MLLDEAWLASLLDRPRPSLTLLHPEPQEALRPGTQPTPAPLLDWGEALDVPAFYDREPELATLARWVVEERCRIVSVLGLGGMGKSALVVTAMHRMAGHFEGVIWRSLRDVPSCSALVDGCLQVLVPDLLREQLDSLEARLSLLMEQLRARRVLLVLDNLEVLLEEGTGHMRVGFEGYARLLRQMGETRHQSCLLLTSREKPADLMPPEGRRAPVRALRLAGLEAAACEHLLMEHEVVGSQEERTRLIERYAGNPLALKIVAETIADLFGRAIKQFLSAGTPIFGSISKLLEDQWTRLTPLEQTVLSWLAILREPVTFEELQAVLVAKLLPVQVLEAMDGLHRRSLLERGQRAGSFTLQSMVCEYVSDRLVTTASQEIQHGRLSLLCEYGVSQAQVQEYMRQTQERLLVAPLLARLQSTAPGSIEVEERLRSLLSEVRRWAQDKQGYAPANL